MRTLEQIAQIDREFLTVNDIAEYLGADPQSIRIQAHKDRAKLGFPVVIVGARVKIPKVGFINYCRGISA